jgi:hypothetical protein
MAKKRKKSAKADLVTEDLLLAEEDLAAMRPALAVAPELVVETLTRRRKRPVKKAKKKAKARKPSPKKARKSAAKKKKSKAARKK